MSKVYLGLDELQEAVTVVGTLKALTIRCDKDDHELLSITCPENLPPDTCLALKQETPAILDKQKKPINPLLGVESLELVKQLAMPELHADARFLAIREQNICSDRIGQLSPCTDFADPSGFLLVTQKLNQRVRPEYPLRWECIRPELSTLTSLDELNPNVKNRWRLWRVISGCWPEAMETWLIPIGYFNAPKNSSGYFYDPLRENSESRHAYELFNERRYQMANLYDKAMKDLEADYENAARKEFEQATRLAETAQNLQRTCDDLNTRLDEICQQDVFSDLRRFKIYSDRGELELMDKGGRIVYYTIASANSYVHNLELKSKNYQEYKKYFETLRERIETAEGTLDTEFSPSSAIVKFPASQATGKEDGAFEKRIFPFSATGVSDLLSWLKENEKRTTDARINLATLEVEE